jgi:hypothetical protein
MRWQNSTWCCVALALLALACGDDTEQDMDPVSGGGAGAAGSAGDGLAGNGGAGNDSAGSAGMAGNGGAGNGGMAGIAGAGGAGSGGMAAPDAGVAGDHCSPGTVYRVRGGGPSVTAVASRCESRDVDGDGEEDHIDNLALEQPLQPGGSAAFSASFETGWIEAELWGTDQPCGEPLELLASGRIESDAIACLPLTATMAHEHLLWVWTFGGGSASELALCETGSCQP